MYINETFYIDAVYDESINTYRDITDLERQIVKYCWRGYDTEACENLRYAKFEQEPFMTVDLLQAAKDILAHERLADIDDTELKKWLRRKPIRTIIKTTKKLDFLRNLKKYIEQVEGNAV